MPPSPNHPSWKFRAVIAFGIGFAVSQYVGPLGEVADQSQPTAAVSPSRQATRSASASPNRDTPSPQPTEKAGSAAATYVLGISIDGLGTNAIRTLGEDKLPNFHRLMTEGTGTLNARSDYDLTETLPNHTSMITGRSVGGPDGHHVTDNSDKGKTILDYAKEPVSSVYSVVHDHGGKTSLYTSKPKFDVLDRSYDKQNGAEDETGEDNGRDKLDIYTRTDINKTTATYLKDLEKSENPATFTLLHIADPDIAGHADDYGSSKYLKAVEHSDELVGEVMDTIQEDSRLNGHMVLILTADHGGHNADDAKSHDDNTRIDNYQIPFYVWGGKENRAIKAGTDLYAINKDARTDPSTKRISPTIKGSGQPIRNADMANLALDLLGLPAVQDSNADSKQDLEVDG